MPYGDVRRGELVEPCARDAGLERAAEPVPERAHQPALERRQPGIAGRPVIQRARPSPNGP
jgi:hypothetical protein